jgi:hypothetical protein
MAATGVRSSASFFDSIHDFFTCQIHDNAVDVTVFIGHLVARNHPERFIHIALGNLNIASHLLTRKTMRTIMRIKTTVPPPMYMVNAPFWDDPFRTFFIACELDRKDARTKGPVHHGNGLLGNLKPNL